MENKMIEILSLCKQAKEKGLLVRVSNDGSRTEFYHQQPGDYKLIIDISAYTETSLDCIIAYLKGLTA